MQKTHKDESLQKFSKCLVELYKLNRGNVKEVSFQVLVEQRQTLQRNLDDLAKRFSMNTHGEDRRDLEAIQGRIISVTNLN